MALRSMVTVWPWLAAGSWVLAARADITILPPSGVNLRALLSRLVNTCWSCIGKQ